VYQLIQIHTFTDSFLSLASLRTFSPQGILTIAMPVTVFGSAFAKYYLVWDRAQKEDEALAEAEAAARREAQDAEAASGANDFEKASVSLSPSFSAVSTPQAANPEAEEDEDEDEGGHAVDNAARSSDWQAI
jgi:hypothetical protein